ncbi:MAG: FISUMP domain-containing protein, partial [Bacteroidota bacterium]|nr:FISUMP domain-containing protein [Bacteroidota bacterium]
FFISLCKQIQLFNLTNQITMKKLSLLFTSSLIACMLFAQDYKVSFSANGLATETDSVKIENITQGKDTIVYGQDTLHLLDVVSSAESMESSTDVKLYPNPASGQSYLEFYSPEDGTTKLIISDVSGKRLLTRQMETQPGTNRIKISGLKCGIYLLTLHQHGEQYTHKLIVTSGNGGNLQAEISSPGATGLSIKSVKADGLVEWQYDDEDILIFTGYGNGHSRIHVYYIHMDTEVTFNLISCEDPDGHKYTVTTIDGVTWMAENLQTSKYNNNVPIPNIPDQTTWVDLTTGGRCYLAYDSASYASTYGALYNFEAVSSGNLCPNGWHVPSETEFENMIITLQNTGYNYDGYVDDDNDYTTNNKTAKALCSTSSWKASTTEGVPGNDDYPSYRNRSGFSALAAGENAVSEEEVAKFWSSTDLGADNAAILNLVYFYEAAQIENSVKISGLSVRCVKD